MPFICGIGKGPGDGSDKSVIGNAVPTVFLRRNEVGHIFSPRSDTHVMKSLYSRTSNHNNEIHTPPQFLHRFINMNSLKKGFDF